VNQHRKGALKRLQSFELCCKSRAMMGVAPEIDVAFAHESRMTRQSHGPCILTFH
jgi:hypothetical protein